MSGTSDHVISDVSMIAAYGRMHSPKGLILLRGAGHLVFADLCEVGSSQGGLLSIAAVLHVPVPASLVPLASDRFRAGSAAAPGMAGDPFRRLLRSCGTCSDSTAPPPASPASPPPTEHRRGMRALPGP